MGKNSLVKSTSKKKTKTKKKDEEKEITAAQKAAPKKKAAPKAKAAPKKAAPKKMAAPKAKAAPKKAAPKKMAAPKAKAAPKKMAAPKAEAPPEKKVPAVQATKVVPKKKTVSVKDLLQKKFDTWKPKKLYTVRPDKQYLKDFTAPPFASGTQEETRQIKELLLKKFDIAEIKAAGEKITAEKAAAEKAAAEKAAEPEISTPQVPPVDTDFVDPMDKAMKYFAACLIFLVALVIGASALNSSNYYLETGDGAVKIWQGKFAPMGKKLLFTLPGVPPPEPVKEKYSRKEAFPLIFNHYVEKADTLLEVPGMPDFDNIKSYLNKSLSYAVTSDMGKIAHDRLDNIDLMILLYKAEVATSRGTLSDLEDAKSYLVQASKLNSDDLKSDMIDQKIESLDKSIATLKAKEALEAAQTETKPAPPPEEKE